jgi:general secretion pathway protein D
MRLRMVSGVVALLLLPELAPAQESAVARDSKSSRDDGTPVMEIIERYAKRTGKKVIIDPRVRANVDVAGLDLNQLTWEQLLAILDVHNFAAVDQGGLITVLPDANARQFATPVYTDFNFKAADHELVTLLVEVKNACSAQLVPVLRPLMPQAAHMAAVVQTNTLILSDDAVNVRRIAQLVEQLDRAAPSGQKCKEMPAPKPKE